MQFDDPASMSGLVELQNTVYAGSHNFTPESFKFLYLDNPMGQVISFNAVCGERLAAHYACIPVKMKIEGRVVSGLLDIATVTHPDHRGRGLFKKLAGITFNYAKENGYEFILGVANASSFPGYMKYFDFKFVSKLDVKIGIGVDIFPRQEKTFSMYWNEESLIWRLGKPEYSSKNNVVYGEVPFRSFKSVPGLKLLMGGYQRDLVDKLKLGRTNFVLHPVNLYIGLGADTSGGLYFNIPGFIKHSPFNLIFMDLTGKLPEINKDNIFFQLADFDVA